MFCLMEEAGGCGLAAPQVGIDGRFFVTTWGEVFVNPKISLFKNRYWTTEGCLSLDGQYKVHRYEGITLEDGRQYYGHKAQVILHELDHLNGILISDEGIPQ
jgi:peptide deformylase